MGHPCAVRFPAASKRSNVELASNAFGPVKAMAFVTSSLPRRLPSGLKRKNLKRAVKLLEPMRSHEPCADSANKRPPRATSSVLSFKYLFKVGIGMFGTQPGQVQRALHT